MANTKHVGIIKSTGRRCVVIFREIPGEPDNCLIVDTDALTDWMHDDVINAVESPGAQASPNFYEYAQRTVFKDGSNMLTTLHTRGMLIKQPTTNVEMVPNSNIKILLSELNQMISQQNGGQEAVKKPEDQLDIASKQVNSTESNVMDDDALAKSFIDQAEHFEAEAKKLREQAYEINPDLNVNK